jgi:hypothetical protein
MKEIDSIASALFDKIRSRFSSVTLGDEKANSTTDPRKARFFNINYTSKKTGRNEPEEKSRGFGKVTISLIDKTGLKIYYGHDISSEMDRAQREEWYDFLRNLRQFARRNLLTFDTRDINKSNLELQDIKQQSIDNDVITADEVRINENKLYGKPNRPYTSFADHGKTRILIKHSDKVNDDVRGSRSRKIEKIFLENELGERLLLGSNNLHGAYAMAEHLNQGGSTSDERAEHIKDIMKEMSAMRHFVRSTKRRQFEDQETADMSSAAVRRYSSLKKKLRRMSSPRGYRSYYEEFVPEDSRENGLDLSSLKEKFVKKVYDERFDEALPYVYRAYKKDQDSLSEWTSALEEWASAVTESAWKEPKSDSEIEKLEELMKSPILTGLDGMDAQTKIEEFIGDDDLNNAIYHLSQDQGPDADIRPLVKAWMEENDPELLDQIDIGEKNTQDAQTDFVQPVSPGDDKPTEYGTASTSTQNDSNMTYESVDPLNYLRGLAGIQKS